jgi:DNA-binding YbaB/EbfC family protein
VKNLGQMMRQAQEMQDKLQNMQHDLSEIEVMGSSGGGLVRITLSGKTEARRVEIDPSLLKESERQVLEDLLVAAINDARVKVEATAQQKMAELTGGLQLPPGLKLPF